MALYLNNKIKPFLKAYLEQYSTMVDMLDKTDAVGISTTNAIAYQNTDYYPNLKYFKLKDCSITGEIGWIKRADAPLSDIALSFLQILTSYYSLLNGELPI